MQRSYGELEAALLAAEERVAVLCSENERPNAQVRRLEVLQPPRPSVHLFCRPTPKNAAPAEGLGILRRTR